MKPRKSYAFPQIRCFAPRKAHIGNHVPVSKNDNPCCFLQTSDNQPFIQFLQVFVSYCLSKDYHNEKYKALILKYKAHILKYMPCIFYDKPCVFSHIPKSTEKWPVFHPSHPLSWIFKKIALQRTREHFRTVCICQRFCLTNYPFSTFYCIFAVL